MCEDYFRVSIDGRTVSAGSVVPGSPMETLDPAQRLRSCAVQLELRFGIAGHNYESVTHSRPSANTHQDVVGPSEKGDRWMTCRSPLSN